MTGIHPFAMIPNLGELEIGGYIWRLYPVSDLTVFGHKAKHSKIQ